MTDATYDPDAAGRSALRRLADSLERRAKDKYKAAAEHPDLKISATWNINSGELLEQIASDIRSSLI